MSATTAVTLIGGAVLVAGAWWTSWAGSPPLRNVTFFPLWLGYVLCVDGLVQWRTGSSLLVRAPQHLVKLFVLSAPVWWFFEAVNLRLGNWHYLGGELFSPLSYAFWATLAFSTVIPAVFQTAELVHSFGWRVQLPPLRILARRSMAMATTMAGVAAGLAVLLVPQLAFPLAWVFPWLICDGINQLAGRPTLLADWARGDWSRTVTLGAAGLICGFFWEMWNLNAYPKWTYTVPFVDFGRVFEMPLLGYGGYIPFAWSLFAFYQLIGTIVGRPARVTLTARAGA